MGSFETMERREKEEENLLYTRKDICDELANITSEVSLLREAIQEKDKLGFWGEIFTGAMRGAIIWFIIYTAVKAAMGQ